MDETMQMVAVMEAFGWSYREYMETPAYVITAFIEKTKRDRKREELAANRARRGN